MTSAVGGMLNTSTTTTILGQEMPKGTSNNINTILGQQTAKGTSNNVNTSWTIQLNSVVIQPDMSFGFPNLDKITQVCK